jgi:hypothetical protein
VNNVNVPVTGVSVTPTTATINTGATQQLTATVSPANATNKTVSWSSNNTAVATVNASGLVTGVSQGSAIITVTTQSGNRTATSTITVNAAAGTITCYRSSGSITVNGSLTESSWVVTRTFSKTVTGTANNTATFGVLWDNTNLYIGAKVLDGNLHSDSPNPWEDDAVEIYIDANNNKLGSYDGRDNQIIKNYNKSTVFTKLSVTGLQHGWAAIAGGYSVEVSIPWSQLGITSPAQGTTLGFDIGYDDDDNAGARDGQAVWNGTINNYASTAGFGSLVLNSGTGAREVTEEVDALNSTESDVNYWPTLVEHELNIETDGTYESVEVIDMVGRIQIRESISKKTSILLNVENLSGGVHIVKVRGNIRNTAFRIVKK